MRWFLILACTSLGALLAAQWWLWPAQRPLSPPPSSQLDAAEPGQATGVIPTYRLPPLRDFREITERTLFTETRRPPPPGENTAAETAQSVGQILPEHLGLTAILITPDGPTALINDSKENAVMRLAQGANLAGWKIANILPDRLILTQGRKHQEMLLRRFDLAPPPAPAAKQQPTAKSAPKPQRKARTDPRERLKKLQRRQLQRKPR